MDPATGDVTRDTLRYGPPGRSDIMAMTCQHASRCDKLQQIPRSTTAQAPPYLSPQATGGPARALPGRCPALLQTPDALNCLLLLPLHQLQLQQAPPARPPARPTPVHQHCPAPPPSASAWAVAWAPVGCPAPPGPASGCTPAGGGHTRVRTAGHHVWHLVQQVTC
jgi:hypothetical protein